MINLLQLTLTAFFSFATLNATEAPDPKLYSPRSDSDILLLQCERNPEDQYIVKFMGKTSYVQIIDGIHINITSGDSSNGIVRPQYLTARLEKAPHREGFVYGDSKEELGIYFSHIYVGEDVVKGKEGPVNIEFNTTDFANRGPRWALYDCRPLFHRQNGEGNLQPSTAE